MNPLLINFHGFVECHLSDNRVDSFPDLTGVYRPRGSQRGRCQLRSARHGKIVAAGSAYNGRDYDFALARYWGLLSPPKIYLPLLLRQ